MLVRCPIVSFFDGHERHSPAHGQWDISPASRQKSARRADTARRDTARPGQISRIRLAQRIHDSCETQTWGEEGVRSVRAARERAEPGTRPDYSRQEPPSSETRWPLGLPHPLCHLMEMLMAVLQTMSKKKLNSRVTAFSQAIPRVCRNACRNVSRHGRTSSWNVTKQEQGFPGRPKINRDCVLVLDGSSTFIRLLLTTPKHAGLPGFMFS